MKIFDGQEYEDNEPVHDLGSFECVGVVEGTNQRSYLGLSVDAPDKLPTYDNLDTGSNARCLDNGDYYEYLASTKSWYKQN